MDNIYMKNCVFVLLFCAFNINAAEANLPNNIGNEDMPVDDLAIGWEMLDLSEEEIRSILQDGKFTNKYNHLFYQIRLLSLECKRHEALPLMNMIPAQYLAKFLVAMEKKFAELRVLANAQLMAKENNDFEYGRLANSFGGHLGALEGIRTELSFFETCKQMRERLEDSELH
jgi:hypothetical protein